MTAYMATEKNRLRTSEKQGDEYKKCIVHKGVKLR
jgi:hypothetical protein